ncbi:predicted protein [Streptomyces sp. SPB78]|nr:predicted protein [Streptomyces sp. SPB78]
MLGESGEGVREAEFEGAPCAGDGRGGGAVVGPVRGDEEGGPRDGGLGAAGRGPGEVEVRAALVLLYKTAPMSGGEWGEGRELLGEFVPPPSA